MTWRVFLKLVAAGFWAQCRYWRAGMVTKQAEKFANGKRVEAMQGKRLEALSQAGRTPLAAVVVEGNAANGPECYPYCPACKTPMVMRTSKRGSHPGSLFWSCAQAPTCRQTMVMWSEGRRSA